MSSLKKKPGTLECYFTAAKKSKVIINYINADVAIFYCHTLKGKNLSGDMCLILVVSVSKLQACLFMMLIHYLVRYLSSF